MGRVDYMFPSKSSLLLSYAYFTPGVPAVFLPGAIPDNIHGAYDVPSSAHGLLIPATTSESALATSVVTIVKTKLPTYAIMGWVLAGGGAVVVVLALALCYIIRARMRARVICTPTSAGIDHSSKSRSRVVASPTPVSGLSNTPTLPYCIPSPPSSLPRNRHSAPVPPRPLLSPELLPAVPGPPRPRRPPHHHRRSLPLPGRPHDPHSSSASPGHGDPRARRATPPQRRHTTPHEPRPASAHVAFPARAHIEAIREELAKIRLEHAELTRTAQLPPPYDGPRPRPAPQLQDERRRLRLAGWAADSQDVGCVPRSKEQQESGSGSSKANSGG